MPKPCTAFARSSLRASPVTMCPAASSLGTASRPSTPVDPISSTRIVLTPFTPDLGRGSRPRCDRRCWSGPFAGLIGPGQQLGDLGDAGLHHPELRLHGGEVLVDLGEIPVNAGEILIDPDKGLAVFPQDFAVLSQRFAVLSLGLA